MIVIDGSVVNVLLPDMVDDLQLTTTDVLWVNSIYSLIFASLLIPIGLVSDKYGRRKLFLIGTVVFMLGSFGAGASTGPDMLIALRAVQAIGASMMLPSSVAIINVMFTGKQRAMAFGLWGAVFGGLLPWGRCWAVGWRRTTPGGGRSISTFRWRSCRASWCGATCRRARSTPATAWTRWGSCSR